MDYLGKKKFKIIHNNIIQGEVNVLILNNLKWRVSNYRMLDIKIGQQTFDPDWQGKSYIGSIPNWFVDSISVSSLEFLRLEGFDNEP